MERKISCFGKRMKVIKENRSNLVILCKGAFNSMKPVKKNGQDENKLKALC